MLTAHEGGGTADEEAIKHFVLEYCQGACDAGAAEARLREAGLFEFEIYQLLDTCPQSLLALQLVIDEMEERYSQEELEAILEVLGTRNTR